MRSRPLPLAPAVASIREILCPSDLSAASDSALDHARMLAARFGGRITLYHAVEVPRVDLGAGPWGPEHEIWRRSERAAREHLEMWARDLGVDSHVVVERTASAHRALVAYIRANQPDLTVMATHGRAGLAHLFLGSVTEMAIQHGRSPVLCVREPAHGVALAYRLIVVPTDLSEASRRAFPLAALVARAFDAEVVGLHVAGFPPGRSLAGVHEAVAAMPTEDSLREFLAPELAGLRLTCRIEVGATWEQIAWAARIEKADIVVMSTHGQDGLGDRILGSNAARVARSASCPVLVA